MANTVPTLSRPENRAPMPFFVDHRKRTSVRGHFTRTSDAADTPQKAATLDRSSGALLRDEVNQTLTTPLANSVHGDRHDLVIDPIGEPAWMRRSVCSSLVARKPPAPPNKQNPNSQQEHDLSLVQRQRPGCHDVPVFRFRVYAIPFSAIRINASNARSLSIRRRNRIMRAPPPVA